MQNPHAALDSISRLLDLAVGQSPLEQASAYAATKVILRDLRAYLDAGRAGKVGVTVDERMMDLDLRLDAIFGMDESDGHSVHQQHVWALQSIDVLKDKISW